MASESDFQPQLRLHPLSWLFVLAAHLKQFVVPLAAVILFNARNNGEFWGLPILALLVVAALWRQWIYRYGFGPRGLVIRDGLFFRNVRQIEYPRIENVDVERNLLHRLLGVAQVTIATSTGGKAEASIRVLGLDAVQELRDRIFRHAGTQPPPAVASADEVLLHLQPAELVRFGLIDNRGLIVVAALAGIMSHEGFSQISAALLRNLSQDLPVGEFVTLGVATQATLIAIALVSVMLALRLLSIGIALVTLFDFRLTRHQQDFHIRHGLLTRVALTLRTRRIQSVHQTRTLLHRLFGRTSLRVDLAGDSGGGDEDHRQHSHKRTHWLAPICTPQQATFLTAAALPDADLRADADWQPLAPNARARLFRRTVYVGTALGLFAAAVLHWLPQSPVRPTWLWLPLYMTPLVVVAWLRAHIYTRNTRWALTPHAILFRDGWLTRRLVVAPRNRLQSVQLSSSPFDRRYGMANVSLDMAGAGSMRDTIRIPLLPLALAQELATALYHSRVDLVTDFAGAAASAGTH